MRKLGIIGVLSMLLVAFSASVALAQNPHYVVGPTFTVSGTQLTATGSVAGLGNENIDVLLTAPVTIDVDCINPAGNVAPGQRTTATATGEATDIRVENGRATFTVTTEPIAEPDPAVVCPNRRWDVEITNVTFGEATLTITQGGEVVLEDTFQP